jgi:radical SAM protein with 4Fe4S-binding SPASM domain
MTIIERFRIWYFDAVRFMGCLSFSRIHNLMLLQLSWWVARFLKVLVVPAGPSALSFEPTTRCNLRCPECPSGLRQFTRDEGYADQALFAAAITSVQSHLIWLNLYFQGEPFLHPGFFQMVKRAKSLRYYVMTSTNGHHLGEQSCRDLIEAGLDRLIISVDGLDQETYSQYRKGGTLSRVLSGVETLCRVRRELGAIHPKIIVQCLKLRHNILQMEELRDAMVATGVDKVEFKTAQFYDLSDENQMIPEQEEHRRYSHRVGKGYVIKSRWPSHCRRLWFGSVITWDGEVIPCCYDKDASYRMGNISKAPFSSIWQGKLYHEFRKRVFLFRHEIPICTNCGEGLDKV